MASARVRKLSKDLHRQRVHQRVRTRVEGTPERPRLCVYRSLGHIYAQVIDDRSGKTLVANAVHGVTSGFKKELDIVGVGYRAELKGKTVSFALGKSHPINFPIPEGIQVAVEKQTHIVVSGADKGQVGQVAADMRSLRPPDPYKQKGVRITGERLKKKAGKAGAKAGGAA